MSLKRVALLLSYVFVAGLAIQVVAVLHLRATGGIRLADATDLLLCLLTAYSGPCGALFGGLFATSATGGRKLAVKGATTAAIAFSACWNILLVVLTFQFTLSAEGDLDEFCTQVIKVAAAVGFLVTAPITYVVGKADAAK